MSVGMGIDYRIVGHEALWISATVLGLFLLKSIITASLCLIFGLPRHTSLEAGLLLGQGGEFAFVVVGLAMTLKLIPADLGQFMLIVTSTDHGRDSAGGAYCRSSGGQAGIQSDYRFSGR